MVGGNPYILVFYDIIIYMSNILWYLFKMKNIEPSYKILNPDNCVMCGMCLNHCPTYMISNNEAESPRGRISIIYGLNNAMLEPSKSALEHINSCTLCLACESVCPAKVDFYQLITAARDKYFKNQKIIFRIKSKLISLFLTNNIFKKIITFSISLLNQKFLKKFNKSIFKFMNYTQIQNSYITKTNKLDVQSSIGIFTGCASDIFEKNVATSCISLLKKNNISSEIINNIKCCGSLDYNSGRIKKGMLFNKAALKEFSNKKYKKIIGYASGCSTFINKNKEDIDYQDATSFILDTLNKKEDLNFKKTNKNICVHKPCTTKSAEIDFLGLLNILKLIPNLKIYTFDDDYCCGAGAQNILHNHENSKNIVKSKIDFINLNKIDLVLTFNIGCSLNFINSINLNEINKVQVIHPITFLNARIAI